MKSGRLHRNIILLSGEIGKEKINLSAGTAARRFAETARAAAGGGFAAFSVSAPPQVRQRAKKLHRGSVSVKAGHGTPVGISEAPLAAAGQSEARVNLSTNCFKLLASADSSSLAAALS